MHACRETQRVCVADDSFTSVMGDGFMVSTAFAKATPLMLRLGSHPHLFHKQVRDTQTVMGDAYSYVFLPLSAGATLAGYAMPPLWLTP